MDAVIQFRGTIYENGYGLIAQKVMRDKDLDAKAKTIYAYLCSFAGVGEDGERTAFPGVSIMMHELGIKSEGTFYKYRKQLIDKGYISIEKQRQEGAKFDNNLYYINAVPMPPKEEEKPHFKNCSMDEPYSNFPSTENPSLENQSTNSNSSISNSFNILERENDLDPTLMQLLKEVCPQLEERNKIFNDLTDQAIEQIDYFYLKHKPEPKVMKSILIRISEYGEKIDRIGGFLISTKDIILEENNRKRSKQKDKPSRVKNDKRRGLLLNGKKEGYTDEDDMPEEELQRMREQVKREVAEMYKK